MGTAVILNLSSLALRFVGTSILHQHMKMNVVNNNNITFKNWISNNIFGIKYLIYMYFDIQSYQ